MAKVTEITWDADHPYSAEGITLLPSPHVNSVPSGDDLDRFLKNPGVKFRIESGKLVVGKSRDDGEPEMRKTSGTGTVIGLNLDDMDAADAIAAVKASSDAVALKAALNGESRTTVISAIKGRLKDLEG